MDEVTQLALAAGGGDRSALSDFVRRTQADVWRFCAHLAGVDHADDVTQDVYARALRSLPGYRAEAPAHLWLLGIARRACADHVRREVRRRRLTDQLLHDARRRGRRVAADNAATHGLVDLIDALPPDYRAAFVLTQVLGLSYAETASVCDCPVGTVRSRVARAREAIVRQIEADEPTTAGGAAET